MNIFRSLAGLVGLQASTPGPTDDYWYNPVGVMTAAGLKVDEDGARKISAWYRGRDILSTSVAMIPRHVYRFLPDDEGREVARQHPLEDIVHRKPNAWQDAFQYFRAGTADVVDHGWHYAFIREGARGFVDSLQPIDPTLVTPKQIESGPLVGRWSFTENCRLRIICAFSASIMAGLNVAPCGSTFGMCQFPRVVTYCRASRAIDSTSGIGPGVSITPPERPPFENRFEA